VHWKYIPIIHSDDRLSDDYLIPTDGILKMTPSDIETSFLLLI